MNNINQLIESLRHLGPEAIREEIDSREKEIKALRVLLRASRQTVRNRRIKQVEGRAQ